MMLSWGILGCPGVIRLTAIGPKRRTLEIGPKRPNRNDPDSCNLVILAVFSMTESDRMNDKTSAPPVMADKTESWLCDELGKLGIDASEDNAK